MTTCCSHKVAQTLIKLSGRKFCSHVRNRSAGLNPESVQNIIDAINAIDKNKLTTERQRSELAFEMNAAQFEFSCESDT